MDWSTEFGTNKNLKQNFASSTDEFNAHAEEIKRELALVPTDTLLDVGCNAGQYSRALAPFVNHITGIDSSDILINEAEQRRPVNVTYVVADAIELPFEDATFDKVLMVSTLQYIPDPQKALAEMKRVVKPNGKIFISHIPSLDAKQEYFDGIDALDKTDEEKQKIRDRNNAVTWFDPKMFEHVLADRTPFFSTTL